MSRVDILKLNNGFSLFFLPIAVVTIGSIFSGINLVPLLVVVGTLLFFTSFINTNVALIVLIFSMLLSPEFKVGAITHRDVVLRAEDVFLFIVFFGWLTKMAMNKELGLVRITPVNKSIIAYIAMCLFSSGIGILLGTTDLLPSVFYNLKYIEYFLIFFLVSNNIKNKRQVKIFLFFMLLVCLIVSVYGLNWYFRFGERATAPFEGEQGEPNTLASYLVMMMAMAFGMFIYSDSPISIFLFGASFILSGITLLWTLSRTGWFGFFAMFLSTLIFSKRKKIFLIICLISMIVLFPTTLPTQVIVRFKEAFKPPSYARTFNVFGKTIMMDSSAGARVDSMRGSIKTWRRNPIIGLGVPAKGIVSDVQHTRILREVGVIGYAIFLWMMFSLFMAARRNYDDPRIDNFSRGLSLGFISVLVSIFVMGAAAEVFIIIRVMEPFWFLAAMMVVLPEVNILPEASAVE